MNTHSAQKHKVENKMNLDTKGCKEKVTFNCLSAALAAGVISNGESTKR